MPKRFPTKTQLQAIRTPEFPHGIINSWDLSRLSDGLFITVHGSARFFPAKVQVVHRLKKTDPSAAWYDYGHKTFSFSPREKDAAILAAQEWANATYGPHEWVRDPLGNYQDKKALDKAWELVRTSIPVQEASINE